MSKLGTTKGIKIADSAHDGACIDLNDILKELYKGAAYSWTIHVFQINGYKGTDPAVLAWQDRVENSEMGQAISWSDLCALGNNVFQFIELILVGSEQPGHNIWVQDYKKRYQGPDVYIEMFDSCWWWVFSKDHDFINRLAHKFKDIELLEPGFREKKKS